VPGYLLDNNHVQPLWQKQQKFLARIGAETDKTILRVCTVTLGEIAAGHQMSQTTNQRVRDEYTAWVNAVLLPYALTVSTSTGLYYANIVGRIWKKHPPTTGKIKTEAHLVSLGVDVNDVWTCAVAWEHGLTLLTQDAMGCIREVVDSSELAFDCWI
jgi:predicted nucleic acid-binding protein